MFPAGIAARFGVQIVQLEADCKSHPVRVVHPDAPAAVPGNTPLARPGRIPAPHLLQPAHALRIPMHIDRPGAAGLRERVAELLYLGALRVYMGRLPDGASGWLAALRDPMIGRALQALHAEPSRHWSVDELAAIAGSSRSALATRFAELLDEAPMHYLARLRMSLAARALIGSRKSLAAIADEVGCESPAAFQRAFKRDFHMPPAAWRKNATESAMEAVSPE